MKICMFIVYRYMCVFLTAATDLWLMCGVHTHNSLMVPRVLCFVCVSCVCLWFSHTREDQFIYLMLEKLFIASNQQLNSIWGPQLANKMFTFSALAWTLKAKWWGLIKYSIDITTYVCMGIYKINNFVY